MRGSLDFLLSHCYLSPFSVELQTGASSPEMSSTLQIGLSFPSTFSSFHPGEHQDSRGLSIRPLTREILGGRRASWPQRNFGFPSINTPFDEDRRHYWEPKQGATPPRAPSSAPEINCFIACRSAVEVTLCPISYNYGCTKYDCSLTSIRPV